MADEVADRLRSESERVAGLAQDLEERERLARELEEGGRRCASAGEGCRELDAAWRDAWIPLLVVPPQIHDARAWREDFGRLLERSAAVEEALEQHNELEGWIEEQVKRLGVAMTTLEPTAHAAGGLSMVVAAAERLRQSIEKEGRVRAEHARKTLETEQEIRDADAAVRAAQTDIEAWWRKWEESTRGLVQGDAPPPDDALVALDRVEKILRALEEAGGFEARIAGIDRDAESFRADVRALAERLAETAAMEGGSEDAWVEELHKRLGAALQEDERRREACARLARLRADATRDKEAVTAARLTLAALREEARCGSDDDFAVAEQRSANFRAFQNELARIEKELVRGGDGASIADLEFEARDADKDAIGVRLVQIGTELPGVEKALAEARDARADAQAKLRGLQGLSAASEKAEEVQSTLARLREDVSRVCPLAGGLDATRAADRRLPPQEPDTAPPPRRRALPRDDSPQLRATRSRRRGWSSDPGRS